jgi:hypothetical protein
MDTIRALSDATMNTIIKNYIVILVLVIVILAFGFYLALKPAMFEYFSGGVVVVQPSKEEFKSAR